MNGVVASGHPAVSDAAADLLRAGGNAFDAAVGAGFASTVAEPALTSLGGGGFLLARPPSGAPVLFDFFVDTPGRGGATAEPHFVPVTVRFPSSEQVFNVGLGAVAVPGNLAGYLHVHRRLGRLPLAEVVAPAATLARSGVTLSERQAYVLGLLEPIMTLTAGARELFLQNGSYPGEGQRFRNPDLATFLEALPHGAGRDFYAGDLAARIHKDMHEGLGLLTRSDLGAYRVIEREPLSVRYREHRLLSNPPPSFGGSLLAMSLAIFEGIDLTGTTHGSLPHLRALTRVMQEVDRYRCAGRLGPAQLDASELAASRSAVRAFSRGTTHVSVCDRDGNAASMTTSNGEGSGYVVPGTGIMLNNMMGEDDLHPEGFHSSPPGLRVASMMSPSLLLDRGGRAVVVGSGGSKRIRTALLQIIVGCVDLGLPLAAAIEAPRAHWDGERLQMEPGFDRAVVADLERDVPVNLWKVRDIYFGGAHAVTSSGEHAGDPRRGGAGREA